MSDKVTILDLNTDLLFGEVDVIHMIETPIVPHPDGDIWRPVGGTHLMYGNETIALLSDIPSPTNFANGIGTTISGTGTVLDPLRTNLDIAIFPANSLAATSPAPPSGTSTIGIDITTPVSSILTVTPPTGLNPGQWEISDKFAYVRTSIPVTINFTAHPSSTVTPVVVTFLFTKLDRQVSIMFGNIGYIVPAATTSVNIDIPATLWPAIGTWDPDTTINSAVSNDIEAVIPIASTFESTLFKTVAKISLDVTTGVGFTGNIEPFSFAPPLSWPVSGVGGVFAISNAEIRYLAIA